MLQPTWRFKSSRCIPMRFSKLTVPLFNACAECTGGGILNTLQTCYKHIKANTEGCCRWLSNNNSPELLFKCILTIFINFGQADNVNIPHGIPYLFKVLNFVVYISKPSFTSLTLSLLSSTKHSALQPKNYIITTKLMQARSLPDSVLKDMLFSPGYQLWGHKAPRGSSLGS
jgi:hypothetical protein